MLNTHILRRLQTGALAVLLFVGLAMQAEARQFRLSSGNWLQNRSAQLQVPIFGGIPAAPGALVSATGQSPANLQVLPGAFFGEGPNNPALTGFVFALPKTTLVQISTMFTFTGPGQTDGFNVKIAGGTGFMVPGPKGTRPANFAWCPGAAANPACTTPQTGGSQGTLHGIVKYTAGPNQFGGTMNILTGGAGSLSRVLGTAPVRIVHAPIGTPLASSALRVQAIMGGAYGTTMALPLPSGPITTGAQCAGGQCGTNGIIVVPGTTTQFAVTPSTNSNVAFPWTTGMITGIATEDLPVQPSTFTSTGSDARTPLGAGNITLVAGGLSLRLPAQSVFIMLDKVTMTITPRNLPSMTPVGFAALASIMVVGAGYAIRRRR
jgi:hypothetical protein